MNNKFDNDGFVERSDYLLFFMIDEENVYFIDVTKHRLDDRTEFSQQEQLIIIKRNWPYLIEKYKVATEYTVATAYTDKDISEIRNKGGMSLVEVEGDAYGMIGGGISSARTNVLHTIKSDAVIELLEGMTKIMEQNKTNLLKNPCLHYMNSNFDVTFKLILEDKCFCVINEVTGLTILESTDLYQIIFK